MSKKIKKLVARNCWYVATVLSLFSVGGLILLLLTAKINLLIAILITLSTIATFYVGSRQGSR